MKKLMGIFLLLAGCSPLFLNAQSVGIGTATPHASAQLDISSTTKGVLVPRMTLAQRNAIVNPENSLVIYQTDSKPGFYYNAGAASAPVWKMMGETILPSSAFVLSETKPNALLEAAGFGYNADVVLNLKNASLPANSWTELNDNNSPVDDEKNYMAILCGDFLVLVEEAKIIFEIFSYRISTNTWSKAFVSENMDVRINNDILSGDFLLTDGNFVYSYPANTQTPINCLPPCSNYSGFRYRPSTNEITGYGINVSHTARIGYTPILAGNQILLWGGWGGWSNDVYFNDGLLVNLGTHAWSVVPAGALSNRRNAAGVWTGTDVILFGGNTGAGNFKTDGAKLNLNTLVWTPIAPNPAITQSINYSHWNGTEMMLFGNSSYKYNPSGDSWTTINSALGAIAPKTNLAWTGTEYWRYDPFTNLITLFNPVTNTVSNNYPGGPVWMGGGSVNIWCTNKLFVMNYYHPIPNARFFYPNAQSGVSANKSFYLYKKN